MWDRFDCARQDTSIDVMEMSRADWLNLRDLILKTKKKTFDYFQMMMKEISKRDYSKMSEGELKLLLNKHQRMLDNTRLINALPDQGQRLRDAINQIEKYLAIPSSPMDCDIINQFDQMSMSTNNQELSQDRVYLEKPERNVLKDRFDNNFSDERLNEVKQRLKARQAEREKNATVTTAKLISMDEAVRLYNEEKKETEEHLIQQTTARLLGNMSLSKTTFGLPSVTTLKTDLTYRKTTTENNAEADENDDDELGREKAEIVSDHDSDEIDYPDDEDD